MRPLGSLFVPEHKTSILPLRWLANDVFHPISMWFFHIGLRANDQIYESGEGYTIRDEIKEKVGFNIYNLLKYPYERWGTVYKLDFSTLGIDKLDGAAWDDYDDNGIPYWDYLWNDDPETGDGWRVKNDSSSNKNIY